MQDHKPYTLKKKLLYTTYNKNGFEDFSYTHDHQLLWCVMLLKNKASHKSEKHKHE